MIKLKGNNKRIMHIILIFFVVWTVIIGLDWRTTTHDFRLPKFAIHVDSNDGAARGSGTYVGLGYSFEIDGNFMPEDEFPGVTRVSMYIFGKHVKTAIRDQDLVILTADKEKLISNPGIFDRFGKSEKTRVEYYGAVTSIRIFHEDGFEVEYGITNISWIDKPFDDGTRQVLSDGFKVIVDKGNFFDKTTIGDNDEKIL